MVFSSAAVAMVGLRVDENVGVVKDLDGEEAFEVESFQFEDRVVEVVVKVVVVKLALEDIRREYLLELVVKRAVADET